MADEYYNIANRLYAISAYDDAYDYYQKARSFSKQTNKVHFNLVRLLLKKELYAEAHALTLELYEQDEGNSSVQELLAYSYYRLGNIDKSLALYEDLNTKVPRSRNLYNAAQIHYERGDVDTSMELLELATELDQSSASVYFFYATLLIEQGMKDEGFKNLLIFHELEPSPSERSIELAELYKQIERYSEAREVYSAITTSEIHSSEEQAEAQFSVSRIYLLEEENSDEGLKSLRAALELGFNNRDELIALRDAPAIFVGEAMDALFEEFSISLEDELPSNIPPDMDIENEEQTTSFLPTVIEFSAS